MSSSAGNAKRARVIAPVLCSARGGRRPFFLSPGGMERREAPGACEAPLGRPCDRAARAPCEGARTPCDRGAAPPGAPSTSAIVGRRALFVHRAPLEMTRGAGQGAININAIWRAGIIFFRCLYPALRPLPNVKRVGTCVHAGERARDSKVPCSPELQFSGRYAAVQTDPGRWPCSEPGRRRCARR